jgi:hypothetical protein
MILNLTNSELNLLAMGLASIKTIDSTLLQAKLSHQANTQNLQIMVTKQQPFTCKNTLDSSDLMTPTSPNWENSEIAFLAGN